MNERIQALAEQAGIVFWEMSGDVDWRQANREHLEKFAQLIVQECIDVIDVGGEFVSRPKMVERLKEHFEIE